MREILFRGKDIAGNWHYGVPLVFTEDYVCITAPHTYNKAVIPETVGQFAGLLDKNGKRIFERDIVELTFKSGGEYKGEVVFHNGGFCVEIQNTFVCLQISTVYDFEYLGNVHDNPELLKGE